MKKFLFVIALALSVVAMTAVMPSIALAYHGYGPGWGYSGYYYGYPSYDSYGYGGYGCGACSSGGHGFGAGLPFGTFGIPRFSGMSGFGGLGFGGLGFGGGY